MAKTGHELHEPTHTSDQPLYADLASRLKQGIETGKYKPGDQIPSEPELCELSGYSRSTVRKALEVLVEEGFIVKVRGKGSFVADKVPSVSAEVAFEGFTDMMSRQGGDVGTRTVDAAVVVPKDDYARFLGLGPSEQAVMIKRLRLIDGEPASVETTWLPMAYANLLTMDLDRSLYEVLRTTYGIRPAGGRKVFEVTEATVNEAFLLDIPRGAPLMLITDYVDGSDGKPLHISKRVLRTDRYRYEV